MLRRTSTARWIVATLLLTLPLIVVCTSGGAEDDSGITIEAPWARSEYANQNSAAYMTIVNDGDQGDRLVGVRSDIAVSVEIHEVRESDGQMMRMQQVEAIDIPAGERVVLEPGALHVMFFGLHDDLESGDRFTLTLEFEKAGDYEITVEVRERPTSQGHGG